MDHNLLVSELQALVVESKRRNPEVKEAAEHALDVLRAGPLSRDAIAHHADKLLAPITLGCKTRTGKIIGISIAALQRLVSLRGVPTASLPGVIATLNSVAGQAVDIQLKILQVLLSILTHNLDVHDEVLGSALLLCFKLQDTRVSVVSSTAAATLRQAVMLVFDRISSDTTPPTIPLKLDTDPPTEIAVSASGLDAFNLFSDLCILTAGGGSSGFSLWGGSKEDKPRLLKLSSLQRTFGLELIESVLSGYEDGVKKRHELVYLLAHSLDPLLQKLLHERPTFPIALRVCRLEFLLIRSFSEQLPAQVEGYLTTLIRIGTGDATSIGLSHVDGADEKKDKEHVVPSWLRVLALEIFRGICGDGKLLQNIFVQFDASASSAATEATPSGPKVFAKLVAALGRLLNEKPVLLGSCAQMNGTDVHSTLSHMSGDTGTSGGGVAALAAGHGHGGYLDMGLGMMASAANVGINTVGSMIGGPGGGLGVHSGMKLRLIEQHDKAEAPLIPDTYIYLLALQSLNAVAEAIYLFSGASDSPSPTVLRMAESAWPALLAALSYGISTNLSDTLFAEVLSALSDYTVACGLLSLTTPRDAFLNTLGKYAVPPPAVSAMQAYLDGPTTPRNNSVVDSLGMGVGALTGLPLASVAGPPGLSERNMACLKSMVTTTRILAGSLDERAWHEILETLQNANYMLGAAGAAAAKKPGMGRRGTHATMSPQLGGSPVKRKVSEAGMSVSSGIGTEGGAGTGAGAEQRPAVFDDLDAESIQSMIAVLFDGTRDLDDAAFGGFVAALCRLSDDMIGSGDGLYGSHAPFAAASSQQLGHATRSSRSIDHGQNVIDLTDAPESPAPSALLSPGGDVKRRISGLGMSSSIRSVDRLFSLQKLRLVASLNLARLVNRSPEIGWAPITTHLLAVARHAAAPTTLRLQASDTISELLLGAIRVGKESRTQHQVFDVLVRQVDVWPISNNVSTDYDVRSSGYQTLNSILESSGHELEVGWATIFDMLNNVCKTDKDRQSESTPKLTGSSPMKRSDSSVSISSNRPSALSASKSANLVRIAFPSLTLICTDFLASLDQAAIRQCIACLGAFGKQKEDVNITLAAIGLLWNVSDKVQRDAADGSVGSGAGIAGSSAKDEGSMSRGTGADEDGVWLYLLKVMLDLARDGRLEVRSSAMQTLFRCVEIYGAGQAIRDGVKGGARQAGSEPLLWEQVWWDVISPLLDSPDALVGSAVTATIGSDPSTAHKQASLGDEATVLSLTSTGGIFHSFMPQLACLASFDRVWQRYLERIEFAWKYENRHCCNAALKSLEQSLSPIDPVPEKTSFLLESTWTSVRSLADELDTHVYAQDNLVSLVKICKALHDQLDGYSVRVKERDLSGILRSVMIYDKSPEYRPDTDHMSPLQDSLTELVGRSDKLSWSVKLGDVAEWTSLAFVAGGKCTYVGLGKWGMRWMERVLGGDDLVGATVKASVGGKSNEGPYLGGEEGKKLFEEGTVESVLAAYALPVKMKYDCPPANRFGEDAPLWRTGMESFVPVLRGVMAGLDSLKFKSTAPRDLACLKLTTELTASVSDPVYTQVIDIFASMLLADASPITAEADEAFILPILSQIDALLSPHLGRLPDRLVEVYAETLRRASVLYSFDVDHLGGTTAMAIPERSEDVRYWAFGVLVGAASAKSASKPRYPGVDESDGENDQAHSRDEARGQSAVARIAVQSMEQRMRGAMRGYVEDARLRGQMPLGRVREQELLYILRHLAMLRLHPAPVDDTSSSPSSTLAAAVRTSPLALLFSFYPLLLEIAFLPGHAPSMWMFPDEHAKLYAPRDHLPQVAPVTNDMSAANGDSSDSLAPSAAESKDLNDSAASKGVDMSDDVIDAGDGADLIEVTARDLARRCLELVGEEMGLGTA